MTAPQGLHQVKQLAQRCAAQYMAEQGDIDARRRLVATKLAEIRQAFDTVRPELEGHGCPAKISACAVSVALEFGARPNFVGKLLVEADPMDGLLVVTWERELPTHPGVRDKREQEGRPPHDFAPQAWLGEMAEFFEWVFASPDR